MADSNAAPAALVDRLRRNDAADRELSKASAVISALIRDLPATDDLLLTEASRKALRILRDRSPEVYLAMRAAIRQRCGRHLTDIIDAFVGPPAPGPWREIALLNIDDLLRQQAAEWRIHHTLPETGLGVVFGESGSGKSFFALAAACAIARGENFFGRETKRGPCLYVAAEGRARHRVEAYLRCYNLAPENLDIRFIEQAIDLCGATADLERLEQIVAEFRPAVVVVDTLARVAGGGDENSAADMGKMLGAFRRIEDACGGLVLVIHHSGKDSARGARGHSSLRAAADVEIEVTRAETGIRTARISKLRDQEDGAELHFRLDPIDLDDGRSSCVVLPVSDSQKPKMAERKLTPSERLALDALREQLQATGETLPATSTIPAGKRGVKVAAWRDRFYARQGEGKGSDALRQAFYRGKAGLVNRKLIGCWEDLAWEW